MRFRWRGALVAPLSAISLLVACTQAAPVPPKTGAPAGPAAQPSPTIATTAPAKAASPATGSPTAAGSPAPTGATPKAAAPRVTPKGQIVYLFHTSLSPAWLDPQENTAFITPYCFQYALHDALIKPMPGNPFTPSLAESHESAPDFTSVTFKLRPNLKFHNGDPLTSEDVKFTFEKYRGANAKILHDKTASIDTPDPRTIKFNFKEPFLDFLVLYGSPASGAGWVIPKKYYEQVGPDGFKQRPIGAGPFKWVRGSADIWEFEAFPDYWRKTPAVKTLIFKGTAEDATRVAALQTGEADIINFVPGQLIDTVRNDPKLQLTPVLAAPFWLELVGQEKPDSPFNNVKVRQAISLALDRNALNEAETSGLSVIEGNWFQEDWPGALKLPPPTYDLEKAQQLMAEAGYPNGFDVVQLTPLPPFFSLGERIIGELRKIGIRTKLNQMERGAFFAKVTEGPDALPGIVLNVSGAPGDAASRIRAYGICHPKGASSRACIPEIDAKFARFEASINPREREALLNEIQRDFIDNYIFIPVYRTAFINALGPRIANPKDEIMGSIPQYVYAGPYEDLQVKE